MSENLENNTTATDFNPPQVQSFNLEDMGVVAQLFTAENIIRIYSRDGSELFNFSSQACPWGEQPVRFLASIYKMGFERGRMVGKEVAKIRFRELLQPEL